MRNKFDKQLSKLNEELIQMKSKEKRKRLKTCVSRFFYLSSR